MQEYGAGAAGAAWTLGLFSTIALCALFNLLIGGARAGDTDPVQQTVSIPETPQPRSHAPAPAVPLVARRSVSASPELARWGVTQDADPTKRYWAAAEPNPLSFPDVRTER